MKPSYHGALSQNALTPKKPGVERGHLLHRCPAALAVAQSYNKLPRDSRNAMAETPSAMASLEITR